jgi:hypothetical protein
MSITATIGEMNWDACDECGHCDQETGECKVGASMDDFELESDFVSCRAFATIEEVEAEESHKSAIANVWPGQLSLEE